MRVTRAVRAGALRVRQVVQRAVAHREEQHALPSRPSLPPLLLFGLGLWFAAAVVFSRTQDSAQLLLIAAALGGLVLSGVTSVVLWRRRNLALCLVLGLALGMCAASFGAMKLQAQQNEWQGFSGTVTFMAAADGKEGSFGSSVLARVQRGDGQGVVALVQLGKSVPCPRYGETFEAQVSSESAQPEAAERLWSRGAAVQLRARNLHATPRNDVRGIVVAARNRAIDALSAGGTSGVAAALACGWRGGVDPGVNSDFKASGLAHLVAVSGAHLSLVVAALETALCRFRIPRVVRLALELCCLGAFLCFTAFPASAIRASVMAGIGMLAFSVHRRSNALGALGVCIAAMVAVQPSTALSASFALSALSTLGIALFGPLMQTWAGRFLPRVPRFAREALSLCMASSLCAVPFAVSLFAQLPLAAPLGNVLVAPLFAPVCLASLSGALWGALALPYAAAVAAGANMAGDALASVVHLGAQLPFASVPFDGSPIGGLAFSAALACALWVLWPPPQVASLALCTAAAGLAVAVCFVVLPLSAGLHVTMLDVGQGDAVLVRSGMRALLIDTGNQPEMLRRALARHHVYALDAVVITHGDDDHMASLTDLSRVVAVRRVYLARDALECSCAACGRLRAAASLAAGTGGVQGLSVGDRLSIGAVNLAVVWPTSFSDQGGNADSVCLLASWDADRDGVSDGRALFTGDAEAPQLERLLRTTNIGPVDLLKVGHHGSSASVSDAMLRELSPQVALVSCGKNNRYGHPKPDALSCLSQHGARVYRSDEHGDVSCSLTRSTLEVKTLR